MNDAALGSPAPGRLRRGQLAALDGAVAAVYLGWLLASAIGTARRGEPGLVVWGQCLVAAAVALPLAGRRRWPLAALGIVAAGSAFAGLDGMLSSSFAALALALYTVALSELARGWLPTPVTGTLAVLATLNLLIAGPHSDPWSVAILGVATTSGAWTAGRLVRDRRAAAARSAQQLALRAVAQERLRIARELHDVVAHGMSLIAVKAAVANHVAAARPEEAREALRVIETTSKGALAEMRRLLGILRADEEGAPWPAPGETTRAPVTELAPAPGLTGLRGLAEQAAMAGVHVELDVDAAAELPAGLDLVAYRVVQEAITNVVRHAAPARCRVVVQAGSDELRIEVSDDGPGHRTLPARPGRGHGLMGMRERVTLCGGAFSAGPGPHGGFTVTARIPADPGSRETTAP